MLNLWWPELAGVAQPLSGEWAARRSLLEELPVPVGYGVEIAVLIDTARRHGIDAIAQVDLGERGHSHQADADLAVMAAELMLVVERRRFATFEASEQWATTNSSSSPVRPGNCGPVAGLSRPRSDRPPAQYWRGRLPDDRGKHVRESAGGAPVSASRVRCGSAAASSGRSGGW